MRFLGRALLATSAFVLGACGGGDKTATTTDTAATAAAAPTTAPAASATPATGAPAAGTATMKPPTGKTVDVKMIGDAQGYRFDPANITIKQGDAVKFTMVTGGPHNVAFDANAIPAAGKDQLTANMPNQMQPLSSPFLTNPNETYTISFAGVAPGKYPFFCTPHLAMNMKGEITVE